MQIHSVGIGAISDIADRRGALTLRVVFKRARSVRHALFSGGQGTRRKAYLSFILQSNFDLFESCDRPN